MKEVIIPAGTERIDACAFQDARSLDSIIIPDGVKEIGDRAFEGCTYLKKLIIPSSVEKIGRNICQSCLRLKRFEMHGRAKFARSWLEGCYNLETVILSAESGVRVWNGAVYNQDLTELKFIPWSLKHLILPSTVQSCSISAGIKELSFYAHQQITVSEMGWLQKLHFYAEQKAFTVELPEDEIVLDYPIIEKNVINHIILALQTGELSEDFGAQFSEPQFELRFSLAEIIGELYQKDWKALCQSQAGRVIATMLEYFTEEQIEWELCQFFCNHIKYLFCLDDVPEWKKIVLKELIFTRKSEVIANLLENYHFTEEETDLLLKTANELHKYDTQLILMHYRREKYGYTDITEKLKL